MISSSPIRTLERACSKKSPPGCEGCRATRSAREIAEILLHRTGHEARETRMTNI